jgi:hypothetical protein
LSLLANGSSTEIWPYDEPSSHTNAMRLMLHFLVGQEMPISYRVLKNY